VSVGRFDGELVQLVVGEILGELLIEVVASPPLSHLFGAADLDDPFPVGIGERAELNTFAA
jgi:hypothetical protein